MNGKIEFRIDINMSNFSKIQYYIYILYDFNDLTLVVTNKFHLTITFTIPYEQKYHCNI